MEETERQSVEITPCLTDSDLSSQGGYCAASCQWEEKAT